MRATGSNTAQAWLRQLGSGLVSWLCCSSGLAAQASPMAAPVSVPRERIDTVLRELDQRFARGDVSGYLEVFAPDHPGTHAMLRMRLQRLVAATPQRQRTSTILTEPREIGPRTVVRVRHDVELLQPGAAGPGAAFTQHVFTEHALLAFTTAADGAMVPTFCIDMPVESQRNPDPARPLRCPPCNYQIGGVAGWLCVPMRGEQANALEGASLFLLGTDLACDVTVEIEPEPRRAAVVATELGAALASMEPGARPGKAEPWLPPAHADRQGGLDGARLEIELPDDFPQAGGGRARFHVTTFGGLQHLLLLRGSAAALRTHSDSVRELLASYRVLQFDGNVAQAASDAIEHHTGGVCQGATYRNERFHVVLEGPTGWKLQQRTGGPVFRVVWSSPAGSRLWLTAHRVPAGMPQWTTASADRWLEQLCQQQGLAWPGATNEAGWTPMVECGGNTRTLSLQPPASTGKPPRSLRAMCFDDLLLVADGFSANATEAAELAAAIRSLRRDP